MSNVGFRIFSKIERPEREIIEADNMGRITCVDTYIKPFNEVKLLGTAFTVKAPLGDNLMFHKSIDMAQPGDIIVVDGEGDMCHSLCGEIMFRYAMTRGIAGFLIDGCIRDAASLKELNFPVYARGVNPKGPYKNGPGEINVPVSIGGQAVLPGDIISGDSDGVVVIRPRDAEVMLKKSLAHNQNEVKMFEQIANGTFDRSWVDRTLAEKGCEFIE